MFFFSLLHEESNLKIVIYRKLLEYSINSFNLKLIINIKLVV